MTPPNKAVEAAAPRSQFDAMPIVWLLTELRRGPHGRRASCPLGVVRAL